MCCHRSAEALRPRSELGGEDRQRSLSAARARCLWRVSSPVGDRNSFVNDVNLSLSRRAGHMQKCLSKSGCTKAYACMLAKPKPSFGQKNALRELSPWMRRRTTSRHCRGPCRRTSAEHCPARQKEYGNNPSEALHGTRKCRDEKPPLLLLDRRHDPFYAASNPRMNLLNCTQIRIHLSKRRGLSNALVRGRCLLLRHCCLFAPGSNRGRIQAGRLSAQKEQSLAGRSPSRSQAYPVQEPNDSRRRNPPGRFSLPFGMACSVLVSNNHVPERTPDLQR